MIGRRPRLPREVAALVGERPLAFARHRAGWLVGTRGELVSVADGVLSRRWRWHELYSVDWDGDRLRVLPLGAFDQPRETPEFEVEEPGLLLQLVRERVQASLVLQRHVSVAG